MKDISECENNELSSLDPQFIGIIEDKSIGLLGYVVVDVTVNGHACGGLRIHPNLTVQELKGLARSMTLKYGFSGMAQGGAKAGIVADLETPPETKRKLLRRFAEIAAPLLKSGYYITGTDINTSKSDIADMLSSVGLKIPRQRSTRSEKSGFFTAFAVMVAAESAAYSKGMDLSKSTIAIEGFGAVGSSFAWLMSKRKNAKIIAISTNKGALYSRDGLDIDELIRIKEKAGNDVVNLYNKAEKIKKEKLLLLESDILSPCAIHHSINISNVNSIKSPIICPGANIPVTYEAEKILFKKGIISIPAFVANCGGVIGNKMEVTGADDDYIESFIREKNRERILDLIKISEARKEPMIFIAERYALDRFRRMKNAAEKKSFKNYFYKSALKLFNSCPIPELITKPLVLAYLKRSLGKEEKIH